MKRFLSSILLLCCAYALHAQTPAQSLLPVNLAAYQAAKHQTGRQHQPLSMSTFGTSYPNPATVAQWHAAIGSQVDTFQDWVYSIVETSKKCIIGAGYSAVNVSDTGRQRPAIFKLDNFGNLLWAKTISSVAGSFRGLTPNSGAFTKVIAAADGYVAVGWADDSVGSAVEQVMLIAEFDDNGNYLNNTPIALLPSTSLITYSSPGSISSVTSCRAGGVALDPTNDSLSHLIVSGIAKIVYDGAPFNSAFITKVDLTSGNLASVKSYIGGHYYDYAPGNNVLTKVITQKTNSTTYQIYTCGYVCEANPDTTIGNNANGISQILYTYNNDAWIVSLQVSSGTLSYNHNWTLNKTNIHVGTASINSDSTYQSTTLYPYQDHGPFTARNFFPKTGGTPEIGNSPITTKLCARNNLDERAPDMVLKSSGDTLAVVVIVNNIGNSSSGVNAIANGKGLVNTSGSYVINEYDEYRDCDVFLVKVGVSDYTSTSFKGKNVAHFSGSDFDPSILQDFMGRYIISGSTADSFPGSTNPNLPVAIPDTDGDGENAFIVCTSDTSTLDIWRRSFVADDSRQGANNEDCFCLFCMAPTSDDGYMIAGNNDNNGDDFSVTKFAPVNENALPSGTSYATFGKSSPPAADTLSTGTTSWTSNMNVASLVVVPNGATLNITSCTIGFASARNLYDYFQFPTGDSGRTFGAGILVQPGGRVNIDSSTLRGINFTQTIGSGTDRNMWDGIIVQGTSTVTAMAQQGIVTMTQSTIQDAVYGFYVADIYRAYGDLGVKNTGGFTGDTYVSSYTGYGTDGGGILIADTSTFLDCRCGFTFQGYTGRTPYESNFIGCTFNTDTSGMGDICLYTDANGKNIPASAYGSSWEGYIQAAGNIFTCSPTFAASEWPTGLVSVDARLIVIPSCAVYNDPIIQGENPCATPGVGNTFNNLSTAIVIGPNMTAGAAGSQIIENTFNNNTVAIAATSLTTSLQIDSNTINTPTNGVGLNLEGCVGYEVALNNFSEYGYAVNNYGIIVDNASKTNDEIIQNNTFTHHGYPFAAFGLNGGHSTDGLQVHCNVFGDSAITGISRISYTLGGGVYPGTLANPQGAINSSQANAAANNQFPATCYFSNNDRLWADTRSADSETNIIYYYNNNALFDPGTCYQTSQYTKTATYPISGSDSAVIAVSCPPPSIGYTTGAASAMRTEVAALDSVLTSADSAEDPGIYNELVIERNLDISYVGRYYAFAAQYDSGGMWLESYEKYTQALSFYLEANDTAGVSRMEEYIEEGLGDRVNHADMASAGEDVENARFVAFSKMAVTLYKNHKTWLDLDSADRSTLKAMAAYDSRAGYLAAFADTLLGTGPMLWVQPVIHMDSSDAGRQADLSQNNINGQAALNNFLVYPNPATGTLTIKAGVDGSFYLYNILGQQVGAYTVTGGQATITIPAALASGIYIGRYRPANGQAPGDVRIVLER